MLVMPLRSLSCPTTYCIWRWRRRGGLANKGVSLPPTPAAAPTAGQADLNLKFIPIGPLLIIILVAYRYTLVKKFNNHQDWVLFYARSRFECCLCLSVGAPKGQNKGGSTTMDGGTKRALLLYRGNESERRRRRRRVTCPAAAAAARAPCMHEKLRLLSILIRVTAAAVFGPK